MLATPARASLAAVLLAGLSLTPALAQSNARPVPRLALPEGVGLSSASFGLGGLAEEGQTVRPGIPEGGSAVELDLFASFLPEADFEAPSGAVETQRGGWHAVLTRESGDGSPASLGVRTEATFYDFAAADVLGNQDPLNDVYETSLGASFVARERAEWSWFAGAELALAGEDDAALEDALVFGGLAGVRHRSADDLLVSLGIAARSRLEEDPFVIPFLGFEWQLGERLWLEAEGSEVRVRGQLSEHFDLALRGAFEMRQYRLNSDGPLGGGVLQDDHVELTAGLVWRPNEHGRVRLEAGSVVWRELHVLDDGGAVQADVETESAGIVALSVELSF